MLSMWYINIGKGIPSTVFSKLKSLNISALEEDRKTMTFDIKGWLLPLVNVRPEINCLKSFTYVEKFSIETNGEVVNKMFFSDFML
jgi:hypothetical protein